LESLKDHTRFLLENARYKHPGVFTAKTPQQQAEALQRAGYSESPTYSKALIALIKAYKLEALDAQKPSSEDPPYLAIGALTLFLAGVVYYRKEVGEQLKKLSQH
jgi:N-acetylmuramoyl-L-alanine amidase